MGIARTLLEHGADPDARDSKGWTILHRAIERGKLLRPVFRRADRLYRFNRRIPIICTPNIESLVGDGVAAKFLLERGASVSIVTPERGDTALHLIASSSPDTTSDDSADLLVAVAKMLLDKGLDPNIQNNQGL